MNVPLPNLSAGQRETLEKYLPLLLIVAVGWLAARGLRKSFWSLFGMFWALRASGLLHWL
ncbi:hypothetical protein [Dokdonella sp.]|uniref:hypothetical protein n=1 Tax=Dokdonella sp. TaxID=2291710 RepID=UPI00378437EF